MTRLYYHEQAHLRCHWLRSLLRGLVDDIAILVSFEVRDAESK